MIHESRIVNSNPGKALTDFEGMVKIAGCEVSNLRYADYLDLLTGNLHEVSNESKAVGIELNIMTT